MQALITSILSALTALGFNNPSAMSIFNQMVQAIAGVLNNVLQEMTNTINSFLNAINTLRYGKSGYYTAKALAFQYGDDLIPAVGDLDPTYAVIDTSKQIISQAAFQNFNNSLSLKVATTNTTTGALAQLSNAQLSAFQSYFGAMEIPGIPITIISLPPNILSFAANCTYYAGYDFTNLQANVALQLTAFQTQFQFNGEFFDNDLAEFIKANVPGVRDFFVSNTTLDGVPFSGSKPLQAGYFNYVNGITGNITYTSISG